MEHRVLLIRSPLARSRRMFSGINSSGAAPRKSVCTARMHRRETCTGTLQLQCGTAALHLATVASEALPAAEAWKLCASGMCFSQRQRDRGTRIMRPEETMRRDEEGEKVQRKKTDVEREQRKRKESHVVAGSRQRRHAEERETLLHSSPFTSFLPLFILVRSSSCFHLPHTCTFSRPTVFL